jgi:DNA polymerase elongation subunit (family B)
MYQNIHIKRGTKAHEIHIWDDQIGYQQFSFKPYAYIKSPSGTYQSLYGDKLKKTSFWTEDDLKAGRIFESDIPVTTRVLVDKYGDSSEVSEGHRELYFDIEVEVKDGFPDPSLAENKITAIAFYDKVINHYTCLVLGDVTNYSRGDRTIESFKTETELLQRFYQKYLEINPTILSGWNICGNVGQEGFDIPYLYHRTQRVLGQQIANCLSPIGQVYYDENKKQYKIAGVSCLDYMALYRLFTYTQQSSYRLDYIGQLEVGIGKIEYEGNLDDLYRTDINKYIEYNLNDVVIVKALDDKLKFIDLARGVAHLGHVPYEDVYYSSRYLEGAILVYMRDIGVVAPNKKFGAKINKDGDKFSGAYVKDPIPGRYNWVYDLDLTSMYPSVIMSINISPEMKLGKLVGWDSKEFIKDTPKTYTLEVNGKEKGKYNQDELKNMFDNNKVSVSSNGVLYRMDKKGLIPVLLEKWFNERVEYKALMKKHGDAGDDEKYGYFKRRQHVQKIILNSLYGVLGLPVFRFYDVDNAEAVTVTGQELIKFTETIANHYYNKELGDKEDYCIYTDTDSVFYPALPLVKKRFPNADVTDDNFMTEQILSVAKEIQDFINNGYNYFAQKFLNVKGEHRFDIKQECVAKSAFWVTKKRYGQWIINDGGLTCDKLDVKGLDIVRSNFPPAMRDIMTVVLKDILSNVDKEIIDDKIQTFKKEMKTLPIYDIASPTGVRGLSKYRNTKRTRFKGKTILTETKKGTPVHVKAAIIYNDLLKHFGLVDSEPIRNEEKIKWVYLKDNPYGLPSLALKGYDDPQELLDFAEEYIDRDKIFESQLQKKMVMFYDALGWEFVAEVNENVGKFF